MLGGIAQGLPRNRTGLGGLFFIADQHHGDRGFAQPASLVEGLERVQQGDQPTLVVQHTGAGCRALIAERWNV
ncbi:hypothetical protein D3C76_1596460 [compost metagenome]